MNGGRISELALGIARTFSLLCLLTMQSAIAGETATVSFGVGSKDSGYPPAFIFVSGKLAGALPGTVTIPLEQKGVAVEIGLPSLETPLYTLVLGPQEFEKLSAKVVMSNFAFQSTAAENLWSDLVVSPNAEIAAGMTRAEDGSYSIQLPPSSYQAIAGYVASHGAKPGQKGWFDPVPRENYTTSDLDVQHWVYDQGMQTAVFLPMGGSKSWSGAYPVSLRGKFGLEMHQETWSVRSVPSGADIWTVEGRKGQTDTEIIVLVTGGSYMVLKKFGFLDCPHDSCTRKAWGGKTEFRCPLTPLPRSP